MSINWENIKRIYFVGIKGVGMTPLALIAHEYGFEIAGSDLAEEFITDAVLEERNIAIDEEFAPELIASFFRNSGPDQCLVITTGAHSGYLNPQVQWAKKSGIPYLNQGKALGIFMSGKPFNRVFNGVTVTGSHGKTTTSAMLAACLSFCGYQPSFAVGTSEIIPIGPGGALGKGDLFVAEGDEYVGEPVYDKTPKILYQHPKYAIINNIDFDHPDIYEDLESVKDVMSTFVNGIQSDGVVFVNGDDAAVEDVVAQLPNEISVVRFGSGSADYQLSNLQQVIGKVTFDITRRGSNLGSFDLQIPGAHNAFNASAVIAVLSELGVELDSIKKAVSTYGGCKRRMEKVGETELGAVVVDDYGHHPKEIRATIDALRKFYGKKIICVFQSHTYSRTRSLLQEFANSFVGVEELILLPIFRSQRDTESDVLSSADFTEPFEKALGSVVVKDEISAAVSYLSEKNYNDEYLILTIGAGEVYKVAYELLKV